jgi:hypothetical protein
MSQVEQTPRSTESERPASSLILDSLEIHNFRAFSELRIERLGRVNLITGKNNVGKTCALEALRLFASPASVALLSSLLESRDQFDAGVMSESRGLSKEFELAIERVYGTPGATSELKGRSKFPVEHLFHRNALNSVPSLPVITVGPITPSNRTVSLTIQEDQDTPNSLLTRRKLEIRFDGEKFDVELHDAARIHAFGVFEKPVPHVPVCFVGAPGLGSYDAGRLWDDIALTPQEAHVIEALRLISPAVDGLIMKPIEKNSEGRVPFVKLKGETQPVSLRSLGDGMNRIFGIALALVNAKDGLLLIDEVENGIHYSVQSEIWKTIFHLARLLNVQVFATTHSYDCIKAFDEAARESEDDGVLIRLARRNDQILVAEFDEREIGIAVKGRIEVR